MIISKAKGTDEGAQKRSQLTNESMFSLANSGQIDQSGASEFREIQLNRESGKEALNIAFSFEIFTSGDISQIQITVLGTEFKLLKHKTYKIEVKAPYFPDLHCFRHYNEFHALYKVMKLKYQNINLPTFPSKYTLVNRTEKRKIAFHLLLNKILEIAQMHSGQSQRSILSLLYVFLTKDLTGKEGNNKLQIGTKSSFVIAQSPVPYQSPDPEMAQFQNMLSPIYSEEGDLQQRQYFVDAEPFKISEPHLSDPPEFTGFSLNDLGNSSDGKKQQQKKNVLSTPKAENNESPFSANDLDNITNEKTIFNQLLFQQQEQSTQPQQQLEQQQSKISMKSCDYQDQSSFSTLLSIQNNLKLPGTQLLQKQSILSTNSLFSQNQYLGSSQTQQTQQQPTQTVIINSKNNIWKDEKDFCGYINVQLEGEKRKLLYARVIENTLQLFKHIFDNHFLCCVSFYEAKLQYNPRNCHILEMYHEYDSRKAQISLSEEDPDQFELDQNDPVQNVNEIIEKYEKGTADSDLEPIPLKYTPPEALQKWMAQLKLATIKKQDIDLSDFVFEPIGKLDLLVDEIINFKYYPQNSTVFVRIKSSPFTFYTKENIADSPKWKQNFIFPFSNSYGIIKLEVVSVNNKGWIKEKFIEKILATAEIQIADILGTNQDCKFIKSVQECENTEFRSKQLLKDGITDPKDSKMNIVFYFRNLSLYSSIFAESPDNIYDGVKMSEQKKTIVKYYKLNFTRYKVISGHIMLFIWSINDVFYSKYPVFSKFAMVFFLIYITFADLNNFLLHLLALLLFIIITNNPQINPTYLRLRDKYLFNEINPFYHTPKIYTKKMNDYLKMSQCLSKIKKLNNSIIVEEQNPFTLSQTYQQLKKSFYLLHEWISIVVNYCEKFKNLLTWKDKNRTQQFFIYLLFLYIAILHLPVRLLLFTGCIYNYVVGLKVYQRRYDINLNQGKNLLIYVYKKYWADIKNWEQISTYKFPNENIKKMIIEEGLAHFYLWITEENLKEMDTPEKLILGIATVPKKLFMNKVEGPHQSTKIYKELQKNSKLKLSKYLTTLKVCRNFLYNIPSDCYRILHPKQL